MGKPMEQMYSQRQNFIIVALTGITGSGCSDLADLMQDYFNDWTGKLRRPEDLKPMHSDSKAEMVFQRKFDLCYHVCEKQYQPFKVIKYRNVLLLCTLDFMARNFRDAVEMRDTFANLLKDKFDKSHELLEDLQAKKYCVNNKFTTDELINFGLSDELCDEFIKAAQIDRNKDKRKYREVLYELFIGERFSNFCSSLYGELKRRDYYAKNFFVHRLSTALRATADPTVVVRHEDSFNNDNIFTVVETINALIKGHHEKDPEDSRRFVIDSIRNSMEILYLRERYNAFYMLALHNDGQEIDLIRKKVCLASLKKEWKDTSKEEQESVLTISSRIMNLSRIESEIDDFEDGKFYGSDISRCVTESEIHIAHRNIKELPTREEKRKREFFSTAEQWMKFYALIIRPGLITPSRDERCMSVAYVAKFNSGCLSRQVGCAIVDEEAAIQSVGWNDPPSGQLPCQLRYIEELCKCEEDGDECVIDHNKKLFSSFELKGVVRRNGTAKSFIEYIKEDLSEETLHALSSQGLRYPYCFRSRYNKYKGERDAVNTRSLHAEENSMLRLARSGGMGLRGGTMYVTASPCVLCSKKAYQIGIREIVYLDPYTDIAPDLILACGFDQPELRPFMGAIGETFYKLYKPFLPYKDELSIWENNCRQKHK